jgi:hypothetical protein
MAKKYTTVNDLLHDLVIISKAGGGKRIIILSSDEEGNSFMPLQGLDDQVVYDVSNQELCSEQDCERVGVSGKNAVVLFPMHPSCNYGQ